MTWLIQDVSLRSHQKRISQRDSRRNSVKRIGLASYVVYVVVSALMYTMNVDYGMK
jgi:hypothetical protein